MRVPEPECVVDETILLLLGERAALHWGPERYNWRGAQIASWSVPVACCIKCHGEEVGSAGLSCQHTTHSQCWPEVREDPNVWPRTPCRCGCNHDRSDS